MRRQVLIHFRFFPANAIQLPVVFENKEATRFNNIYFEIQCAIIIKKEVFIWIIEPKIFLSIFEKEIISHFITT